MDIAMSQANLPRPRRQRILGFYLPLMLAGMTALVLLDQSASAAVTSDLSAFKPGNGFRASGSPGETLGPLINKQNVPVWPSTAPETPTPASYKIAGRQTVSVISPANALPLDVELKLPHLRPGDMNRLFNRVENATNAPVAGLRLGEGPKPAQAAPAPKPAAGKGKSGKGKAASTGFMLEDEMPLPPRTAHYVHEDGRKYWMTPAA